MNKPERELFYNLLPGIYRVRDRKAGYPLRAYMNVLEREYRNLEQDLERMYNNWFIETCEPWAIPYIADMMGVRELKDTPNPLPTQRTHVANILAYRRRKGTAHALEQVLENTTGWVARVTELFGQVAMTQNLNHLKSRQGATLNLRGILKKVGGPFDGAAHGIDLRSKANYGRPAIQVGPQYEYNKDNLGVFFWRLACFPIEKSEPGVHHRMRNAVSSDNRSVPAHTLLTFSPLGEDMPIFSNPRYKTTLSERTDERHLPQAINTRALYELLQIYKQHQNDAGMKEIEIGADWLPFAVYLNGEPVDPMDIVIQDIFMRGEGKKHRKQRIRSEEEKNALVTVDPARGRFYFNQSVCLDQVRVSYAYGFSAGMGGGPYERRNTLTPWKELNHPCFVSKDFAGPAENPAEAGPGQPKRFAELSQALAYWRSTKRTGSIIILDNATYHLDADAEIVLKERGNLTIESANGMRPTIIGDINILVQGSFTGLTLNGLLLDGALKLYPHAKNSGLKMEVKHCTLVPRKDRTSIQSLKWNQWEAPRFRQIYGYDPAPQTQDEDPTELDLKLLIDNSICGAIRLTVGVSIIRVTDSVLDGAGQAYALNQAEEGAGDVSMLGYFTNATVFGKVWLREMQSATNTIFMDAVKLRHRNVGNARYSYFHKDSLPPRHYKCVPYDQTLVESEGNTQTELSGLKPVFTSNTYGSPGYAQMAQTCPEIFWKGAENSSEMGAFNCLHVPQRMVNMANALNDHVRFGLKVCIHFEN